MFFRLLWSALFVGEIFQLSSKPGLNPSSVFISRVWIRECFVSVGYSSSDADHSRPQAMDQRSLSMWAFLKCDDMTDYCHREY
jgi:hypothetical protein